MMLTAEASCRLLPQGVYVYMQHNLAALGALQAIKLRLITAGCLEVLRHRRQGIGADVLNSFLNVIRVFLLNCVGKRFRGNVVLFNS